MPAKLTNAQLLQISKSDAKAIGQFRFGIHIAGSSGLSIDQLLENACRDRFGLAQQNLRSARWALAASPAQCRVGLARSYYSIYHAARAVVYFAERGDDYEAHQELPKHIPRDFPEHDQWENAIKN